MKTEDEEKMQQEYGKVEAKIIEETKCGEECRVCKKKGMYTLLKWRYASQQQL